jgi:hypothetical protein
MFESAQDNIFVKKHDGYWFALEKITSDNKHLWLQYATIQSDSRGIDWAHNFNKNFNSSGSFMFREVIKKVHHADIYIVYATTEEPKPLDSWDSYNPIGSSTFKSVGYLSHIVMFVTIITVPGSPLCTHLGISLSIEGAVGGHKGLSLRLHSFGAQEMLKINPSIKYMINAPTHIMESIIISKIPSHVGTIEMQNTLLEREAYGSLTRFRREHPELDPIKAINEYNSFLNPWEFNLFGKKTYLLDVMKDHPPKLSITADAIKVIGTDIHIPKNSTHWLFQSTCRPYGPTHWFLIEYERLAN